MWHDDATGEEKLTVPAAPSIVPIHSNRFASLFGKADWIKKGMGREHNKQLEVKNIRCRVRKTSGVHDISSVTTQATKSQTLTMSVINSFPSLDNRQRRCKDREAESSPFGYATDTLTRGRACCSLGRATRWGKGRGNLFHDELNRRASVEKSDWKESKSEREMKLKKE